MYHQNIENAINKVVGIQFGVMSPEEILNSSVAEIHTQETYDGNIPKIGGLFDPRMGILDHCQLCPTDNLNNKESPGYFGHIRLAHPVFNMQFIMYICKILKCVCIRCSKIRVAKEKRMHAKRETAFKKYVELCSKSREKNCSDCGAEFPNTVVKGSPQIHEIHAIWKVDSGEPRKVILNPMDVLRIFKRITLQDMEVMGFNNKWCKPHWLIQTVLPISPPSMRPSVKQDNNTRMEDDLTHKLCDIIKTNTVLASKMQSKTVKDAVINHWIHLLQYHVATFVDNTIPGVPVAQQRSGRPLKSIKERIKTKEGRVRGNLMGKRVNYSARSVITPDPNLELDQLGVPENIAKNLTFPETVTPYNKAYIRKLLENGKANIHPGAKTYESVANNRTYSLKYVDLDNLLRNIQDGDIVHRHLIDDDIVLFNRQPSLHKMSMMAHRVKVMPYSTFRLNVSVTTPYNADFDKLSVENSRPEKGATC